MLFRSISEFKGDLDDYHYWLQTKPADTCSGNNSPSSSTIQRPDSKKQQRQKQAELRHKTLPLRKKINLLESVMEKAQQRLSELEELLLDSAIYEEPNREQLKKTLQEQGETKASLESSEAQWLELSDQLESL